MTPSSGPPPPHWYQTVGAGVTLTNLTPVEYFRGLLGMTPEERQRVLAGKSPGETRALLDKVREYQALPVSVREERLRQTELHWHLLNLMRLDKTNRAAELKQVWPLDQPMILGALDHWDALAAATRKTLLAKEEFIRLYLEWAARSPAGQKELLASLPTERRARWTREWERWQAMPEDQRAGLCGQFRRFFELPGREQRQTIDALSDAERRDMEEALRNFNELPPADRQLCIISFGKFATLTPEERNQFLTNARRWDAMTAGERQRWRELVGHLPPMPPEPPDLPPMPPGAETPGPARTVTALAKPAGTAR